MKSRRITALTPTTLTLANTSYTVFTLPSGTTGKVRKIMWYSAVSGLLKIGTGDFTQAMPSITMVAGQSDLLTEDQIPGLMFEANIVAQSTAAAAVVLVEVEEF